MAYKKTTRRKQTGLDVMRKKLLDIIASIKKESRQALATRLFKRDLGSETYMPHGGKKKCKTSA